MTMLYSFYAAEGIVYAADSRITRRRAREPLAAQRKVLPLPGFGVSNGVIGFFGLAEVGGRPMSEWLQDIIASHAAPRNADSFARYLTLRIEGDTSRKGDATRRELAEVSGFHIGTFERRDGHVVPTFTFLRNAADFQDGVYTKVGKFLPPHEQLLGRDLTRVPASAVRETLRVRQRAVGIPHWYRNGDVIHFGAIASLLEAAQHGLLQQPRTRFRAPRSLDEWRRVARTLIASTGSLYRSYYASPAPPVGGRVDVEAIPWPS